MFQGASDTAIMDLVLWFVLKDNESKPISNIGCAEMPTDGSDDMSVCRPSGFH